MVGRKKGKKAMRKMVPERMEAEAFERVRAGLSGGERTAPLPVDHPPGFTKVVWGAWDHIVGPQLRFAWEVVSSGELRVGEGDSGGSGGSSFDLRPLSSTASDQLSFDSDFRIAADVHACAVCGRPDCPSPRECQGDPVAGLLARFGDLDSSATSGTLATSATATDGSSQDGLDEASASQEPSSSSVRGRPSEASSFDLISEPADDPSPGRSPDKDSQPSASSDQLLVRPHHFAAPCPLDVRVPAETAAADDANNNLHRAKASSSSPDPDTDEEELAEVLRLASAAEEKADEEGGGVSGVPSPSRDPRDRSIATAHVGREALSEAAYAAVQSLGGEIYRSHSLRRPTEAKLFLCPERDLVVQSFLFGAQEAAGERSVHSLSFLLRHSRRDWLLPRLPTLSAAVRDFVPRLKAALSVEAEEEVLARMTTEWGVLMGLFASLEELALPEPHIDRTLLSGRGNEASPAFLERSIAASLCAKGRVVVTGQASRAYLMTETLAQFLPDTERWRCRRPSRRAAFSAQLAVQYVAKGELAGALELAAAADWPPALVDVDSERVWLAPHLWPHFQLRRRFLTRDVKRILGQEASSRGLRLSLKPLEKVDGTLVGDLVDRLSLLPSEDAVRRQFIRTFVLGLAKRASAFLLFVRQGLGEETALPGPQMDALLRRTRKALDLQPRHDFAAVLAYAERLRPGIARLIYAHKL